jgi:hypothetical protein
MTVKEMEPVAGSLVTGSFSFASGVRSDRRRVKRSTPLAAEGTKPALSKITLPAG